MAALILRCLVTWLSLMLFMIFVLLKLDKLITWNWFLIFIPMWIYDLIVILYWGLKIGLRHRNTDSRERNSAQNIWRIVSGCLKLFFELLLCIYLQYDYNLKLFYVFIPFWSLLLGLVVEAGILAFHWITRFCLLFFWLKQSQFWLISIICIVLHFVLLQSFKIMWTLICLRWSYFGLFIFCNLSLNFQTKIKFFPLWKPK